MPSMNETNRPPEVDRALAYLRRRGTEAPLAEIRRRAAETFAELDALLAPLDAETAASKPAGGGWSVHEIADHLVVSHRPAADQLATLLRGETVESPAVPAGLQSPDPFALSWPTLRADLAALHAGILGLLDGATDAVPLTATAPVLMVIKVPDDDGRATPLHWEERFDWKAVAITLRVHALEHVRQVERVLGAVAA